MNKYFKYQKPEISGGKPKSRLLDWRRERNCETKSHSHF